MQPSVGKVRKGMIPLVFLGHGQTTNADRYITMLTKLKAPTCRVRTAKTTFLVHHSNVRPHTSLKTVEYIAHLGCTVLPHPSYSLDLVPSDFHLFTLCDQHFSYQHFPIIIAAVKESVTCRFIMSVEYSFISGENTIDNGGNYKN